MKTFTVSNAKGGTGKTTSAVNLAGALAERGHRVLLVDMDPQGTATTWLLGNPDLGDRPARALEELAPELAIETTPWGIDVLGGNASLERAAKSLQTEAASDRNLATALDSLPEDRYDAVLVDTPPNPGVLTSNALIAADALIIPVEAKAIGLQGLATMIARARRLGRVLKRELPIAAILICRVDSRTAQSPRVANEIEQYARSSLPGVKAHRIRENVRLADAFEQREPITTLDGRATGALDYREVADDLAERLGLLRTV